MTMHTTQTHDFQHNWAKIVFTQYKLFTLTLYQFYTRLQIIHIGAHDIDLFNHILVGDGPRTSNLPYHKHLYTRLQIIHSILEGAHNITNVNRHIYLILSIL